MAIDRRADLMPGEDPATMSDAEARGWAELYEQLAAAIREVVSRVERSSPDSAELDLLTASLTNAEVRQRYWWDRHAALVGVVVDQVGRSASFHGQMVTLTRREAQLLGFFVRHPGRWWHTRELTARAWNDARLSADQARIYVGRLRAKLPELGSPGQIESHHTFGYRYKEVPASRADAR